MKNQRSLQDICNAIIKNGKDLDSGALIISHKELKIISDYMKIYKTTAEEYYLSIKGSWMILRLGRWEYCNKPCLHFTELSQEQINNIIKCYPLPK